MRLKAVFGSDLGHWDVPDLRERVARGVGARRRRPHHRRRLPPTSPSRTRSPCTDRLLRRNHRRSTSPPSVARDRRPTITLDDSSTAPAPPLWTLVDRTPDDARDPRRRRTLTWGDFERETNQFGRGLEALGLAPGDHVSVVARNHVDYLVAVFGIMRAGMIVTPVKTGWTAAEIEYLLTDANSRAVVTDIPAGREAAPHAGMPVVDFAPADGIAYAAWLASPGRRSAARGPVRLAALVHVRHHRATEGRAYAKDRARLRSRPRSSPVPPFASALRIPRDGIHLVVSRLFHGAPLAFAMSALAAGTPLHIMDRWDASRSRRPPRRDERRSCGVVDHGADDVPPDARAPRRASARKLPVPTLEVIIHGGEPCPIGLEAAHDRLARPDLHRVLRRERGRHDARVHRRLARPPRHRRTDPHRGGRRDPRRRRQRASAEHRRRGLLQDGRSTLLLPGRPREDGVRVPRRRVHRRRHRLRRRRRLPLPLRAGAPTSSSRLA